MVRDDEQDTGSSVGDEDDVEGHAFKWQVQEDSKGRKRVVQGWDPDSAPPGAPQRPAKPARPEGR